MHIVLITRANHSGTGLGRYSDALKDALRALGHKVTVVTPTIPLPQWMVRFLKRSLKWDMEVFFNDNPIWVKYPKADIYHITSQNLATLMLFCRPPGKTVITVHDIIPWIVRDDPALQVYRTPMHALFDRLSLCSLNRADQLVADSVYSADSLNEVIDCSKIPVTTVLLGM